MKLYFNPRSHCRERRTIAVRSSALENFNPRSHCRERHPAGAGRSHASDISIHVPIAGNDRLSVQPGKPRREFQSTFPLQGTTCPRCATPHKDNISIHVPIAGNDETLVIFAREYLKFQSTFPLQGTTGKSVAGIRYIDNFNPRSHCRERRCTLLVLSQLFYISIHVPIAGNDQLFSTSDLLSKLFQSTFPLQGTTLAFIYYFIVSNISIHVPIAGNDNISPL